MFTSDEPILVNFIPNPASFWICKFAIFYINHLPYMCYVGMCRCEGYVFQSESFGLEKGIIFHLNWSFGWKC